MYHPQLHDVAVLAGGVVNFPQGLQNFFFRHYSLTRFISFRR